MPAGGLDHGPAAHWFARDVERAGVFFAEDLSGGIVAEAEDEELLPGSTADVAGEEEAEAAEEFFLGPLFASSFRPRSSWRIFTASVSL